MSLKTPYFLNPCLGLSLFSLLAAPAGYAVVLTLEPGGSASLHNPGSDPIIVTSYTITASGAVDLSPSTWFSLFAQSEPFSETSATISVITEVASSSDGLRLEAGESRHIGVPFDISADIDADGEVGFTDFLILANNFGLPGPGPANGDVNLDGIVDFVDFSLLATQFGSTLEYDFSSTVERVPEPSSAIYLGMFTALLTCRRRRSETFA